MQIFFIGFTNTDSCQCNLEMVHKLLLGGKKTHFLTFAGLIWFQMVFQLDEIELHNLPFYAWPNVPAEV